MRLTRNHVRSSPAPRSGVTLVENALVISVFTVFLWGIIELGHAYLVVGTLNAAAKRSARYGSCDNVTTQQVKDYCNKILGKSFKVNKATVLVKDANLFDTSGTLPATIDYNALPNIELSTAPARRMFVIRVTVPYDQIALMPPFFVKNLTLHGQSVMRHE